MTYKDIKFEQKIAYLRRLLDIRVRLLMDYIESVDVIPKRDVIEVIWYTKPDAIKKISYNESIEFPIRDLNKRIAHYKRKVRKEYKERHSKTKKPKL